jgi:hypothetical protein
MLGMYVCTYDSSAENIHICVCMLGLLPWPMTMARSCTKFFEEDAEMFCVVNGRV